MAFDLPSRRIQTQEVRTTKRNVPVEQIMAVGGQGAITKGIDVAGNLIGQSLQRRAANQEHGRQLAQAEQLAKRPPGTYSNLSPQMVQADVSSRVKQQADMEEAARQNEQKVMKVRALETQFKYPPGSLGNDYDVATMKVKSDLEANSQASGAAAENRAQRQEQFKLKTSKDIVDRFNSDSNVKKIQTSIQSANTVRELVVSGNPIAHGAIPTYMARASGEVGNLSEADKAPFGGTRAIMGKLEQSLKQMADGKLTQDNAAFIMKLADTMETSANSNLEILARKRASQYSKVRGMNLSEQDVLTSLSPGSGVVKLKQLPTAKKATHRWNPQTGKVEPVQ